MKHVRNIAFTCLAAAALVIAGPMDRGMAQTEVAIGTAKDPNLAAQIVIARDKGFFTEAGLDAEISYFPSGGDLMAAFVGGSVDIGSSGSTPTTILRSRPFPAFIIAQVSDISGAQQLIVHEDVDEMEDLVGKTIGIMSGTSSEALFQSILADQGLAADQFELVNLGPSEMVLAFVHGEVDAISLWEPHTTRARGLTNGKILVSGTTSFFGGEEADDRVYGDHAVLFTSEDYLNGEPETVRTVLDALVKASEFIRTNREEAVEILAAEFELTPEEMSDVVDVNNYTLMLDETLVSDMNSLAEFLASRDKIESTVGVRDWIEPEPLSEVAPDLVAID